METDNSLSAALERLRGVIGAENVIDDLAERAYVSQDYYKTAKPVDAVIKPASVEHLSEALKIITAARIAIFPRGGGYSYTDAYLPTRSPSVCLDTRSLDRIVEVNERDMYVTAEAGCTWAQLEAHLKPMGLRTPFWGPLSGLNATLGGGISQGAASLGSGKYGLSPESVVSLDVVAADGTVIRTGSAGQTGHSPFFRHYGPDLTGLFCNDAGALGIKARITLRLQKRKPLVQGLSFGFDSFEAMVEAIRAVAALNSATENSGMTLSALRKAAMTQSFAEDVKIFLQVAKSGPNVVGSSLRALKMAFAGRRYISDFHSSANFVVEGHNRAHLSGQLRAVRLAVGAMGKEIPNTVPTVMRANPFADYDMLHPDGRRQLPMHAIFPYSQVATFNRQYHELLEHNAETMERHGVSQISVYSGVSTNGFLFEPVLLWSDTVEDFHRRHSSDAVLANVKATEPNHAARTVVANLHRDIVDLMYRCGGVHLQIGKAYPYLRERDPSLVQMLMDLKRRVDPEGLINPGALGLPAAP